MPGNLTRASFEEHLHTKFYVSDESAPPVEMELVEAIEKQLGKVYSLSLLFIGPEDTPLGQKIYKVEHDNMEPLDLFMVPVGKSGAGMEYEVIFSRLSE